MLRNSKNSSLGLICKGAYAIALGMPIMAISAFSSTASNFTHNQEFKTRNNELKNTQKSLDSSELLKVETNQKSFIVSQEEYKSAELEDVDETKVLIAEVIIEGLEDHQEKRVLEFAAYDAMKIRPGSKVTKDEVKRDLDAVYSTGWFSAVVIESLNGPLGVQLLVKVEPNPLLKKIQILPESNKIPSKRIKQIFSSDYGRTLNLNVLQSRMKELKSWYLDQGYSLVKISGPNRVTPQGVVQLKVQEGTVAGVEIIFLNQEGDDIDVKGRKIKGKTKRWVIERELSTKKGTIFNRRKLEQDIKRLYATSLFSDIKVSLKPSPDKASEVIITLGISEQRTGSLTGGIGYSGAQGIFGTGGLQESNFAGRAWKTNANITYGEYGYLLNLSLSDPWIKGDRYRTSFRTNVYISREVPQEFRSESGGSIKTASEYYDAKSSTAYDITSTENGGPFSSVNAAQKDATGKSFSWFDYEGDSVVLEKVGGGFSFARPLNNGDPFKKVPWSVLVGMNFQKVSPIDYSGNERPYGVASKKYKNKSASNNDVICVAFNCANENTLVSFKVGTTYNKLDDSRNPNSGDFATLGTEQFISVGKNSPTFNRARVTYAHFIPVNLLKIHKGCRPKTKQEEDCNQAIGLQVKAGTIVGDLPPYEAFCIGGSSSVRGWSSCDLGVGRSFGEATAEYRFPIWRIISGSFFADAGTDFGSQANVPGKPGELLDKEGSGFSLGSGVIVNTPVGPVRLEAASKDFGDDWRYNLGIGWKF